MLKRVKLLLLMGVMAALPVISLKAPSFWMGHNYNRKADRPDLLLGLEVKTSCSNSKCGKSIICKECRAQVSDKFYASEISKGWVGASPEIFATNNSQQMHYPGERVHGSIMEGCPYLGQYNDNGEFVRSDKPDSDSDDESVGGQNRMIPESGQDVRRTIPRRARFVKTKEYDKNKLRKSLRSLRNQTITQPEIGRVDPWIGGSGPDPVRPHKAIGGGNQTITLPGEGGNGWRNELPRVCPGVNGNGGGQQRLRTQPEVPFEERGFGSKDPELLNTRVFEEWENHQKLKAWENSAKIKNLKEQLSEAFTGNNANKMSELMKAIEADALDKKMMSQADVDGLKKKRDADLRGAVEKTLEPDEKDCLLDPITGQDINVGEFQKKYVDALRRAGYFGDKFGNNRRIEVDPPFVEQNETEVLPELKKKLEDAQWYKDAMGKPSGKKCEELFNKAMATTNPRERAKIFKDAEKLVNDMVKNKELDPVKAKHGLEEAKRDIRDAHQQSDDQARQQRQEKIADHLKHAKNPENKKLPEAKRKEKADLFKQGLEESLKNNDIKKPEAIKKLNELKKDLGLPESKPEELFKDIPDDEDDDDDAQTVTGTETPGGTTNADKSFRARAGKIWSNHKPPIFIVGGLVLILVGGVVAAYTIPQAREFLRKFGIKLPFTKTASEMEDEKKPSEEKTAARGQKTSRRNSRSAGA